MGRKQSKASRSPASSADALEAELDAQVEPTADERVVLEAERKIRAADARVREERAKTKAALDALEEAEDRLDVALAIQEPVKLHKVPEPKRKTNEATAFLIASDWHVGELVDPKTINGRNEYTPDIARKSADAFFANGARLVELGRSGTRIDTVVLGFLGDMITGYIHEELVESNPLSPTEEVLLFLDLAESGINYLLDRLGPKRIVVPCTYGNHGRTTLRRRVSTGAKNSYEWLAYQVLARRFRDHDRVEFQIADGAHLYLDTYGHVTRFHHGDDVRFQGGVGGLSIPLNKAIDRWDDFQQAQQTVIGHWHQLMYLPGAVVNGSLIGYGPYALSIKARFEPPQQAFFLVDRQHGRTVTAPIRIR